MFFWLYKHLDPHSHYVPLFNLMRYLTFRTGLSLITAQIVVGLMGNRFIDWMRARQGKGQPIRAEGIERHVIEKKGTPTMGGVMILAGVLVGTLLWADLSNAYVWAVLLVTTGYGLLGFSDDYAKVTKQSTAGVSSRVRLILEILIAAIAVWIMVMHFGSPALPDKGLSTSIAFPVFKKLLLNLGWFYLVFGAFVIVGAGNAVNFTDGLDGLAIVPVMIAAAAFGFIAYVVGNVKFADYLQVHQVPEVGDIAVFCGALIGAGMGFLWFNAPPARIFMGDTGSLALGGALGAVAIATKHEIVLAIVGGLFVFETISVIVQVISFKTTGKRVFRMAPIHHHFEQLGWSEPQIVMRFWIIAFVLAMIGLSTLKLR